jgi:hypothetical protein
MRCPQIFFLVLFVGLAFLSAGCSTNLETAGFGPTALDVCNRHDAYVNADKTLTPAVQTADLAESVFLRTEISSNTSVPAATVQTPILDVANRQDAYVKADATLTPLYYRIDLRDTDLLRTLLGQPIVNGALTQSTTTP